MTLDEHIEEVGDEFDFQRVYRVMQHLNWTWVTAEDGVPSIGEMRKKVRWLMKECYNRAWEYDGPEYTLGTGGFEVCYYKEYDFFEVRFVITEWRTDYRNE